MNLRPLDDYAVLIFIDNVHIVVRVFLLRWFFRSVPFHARHGSTGMEVITSEVFKEFYGVFLVLLIPHLARHNKSRV